MIMFGSFPPSLWLVCAIKVYSVAWEPTLLWNHYTHHRIVSVNACFRQQSWNSRENRGRVVLMFRLRNLFLVAGIVLIGTAVATPGGSSKGCEASSYGACFRVHAR